MHKPTLEIGYDSDQALHSYPMIYVCTTLPPPLVLNTLLLYIEDSQMNLANKTAR